MNRIETWREYYTRMEKVIKNTEDGDAVAMKDFVELTAIKIPEAFNDFILVKWRWAEREIVKLKDQIERLKSDFNDAVIPENDPPPRPMFCKYCGEKIGEDS